MVLVPPERTIGFSLRLIVDRFTWNADDLTAFIRQFILLTSFSLFFNTAPITRR